MAEASPTRRPGASLWIGPRLHYLNRLCLLSHVQHGHPTTLICVSSPMSWTLAKMSRTKNRRRRQKSLKLARMQPSYGWPRPAQATHLETRGAMQTSKPSFWT